MCSKLIREPLFDRPALAAWAAGVIIAIVLAGAQATKMLGDFAKEELLRDNNAAITALSDFFEHRMDTAERIAKALSGSPGVLSLFDGPGKMADTAKADEALDRYAYSFSESICYIMDGKGLVAASSNRKAKDSFVGCNYRHRPYFTEAMKGRPGRYFAEGMTSRKRGYYASSPVTVGGEVRGVVVVKRSLADIEQQFSDFGKCFLVNENGVIFLSGEPELRYRTLWPLNDEKLLQIAESGQFVPHRSHALADKDLTDRSEVTCGGKKYLVSRKFINYDGWSIILLTPESRIFIYRLFGLVSTASVAFIMTIFFSIIYYTRRSNMVLRESDERFQQIAFTSQDWIWEIDKDGKYVYSNQSVRDLLGYEPAEILGRHFFDLFVPEKRDELILRTKALFSSRQPFLCVILEEVTKKGEIVIHESTGSPIFNRKGDVVGYRGVNKDVTRRKQAEKALKETLERLKETQSQLIQAEKMSAVGQLAGGVAHEVKTPLATIIMAIEYLESRLGDDREEQIKKLKVIKNAAIGADKIVRGLLDFSRPSPLEAAECDMNSIIGAALDLVEKQLTLKGVKIEKDLGGGLPPVVVDRNKMNQVFLNIIINSLQAMPGGGTITIKTYISDLRVSRSQWFGKQKEIMRSMNRLVTAEITDTGTGIAEKDLARIFDPFFTTKPPGEGTGLGLSITRSIVEEHKGMIKVASVKGKGTTVKVMIPESDGVSRKK